MTKAPKPPTKPKAAHGGPRPNSGPKRVPPAQNAYPDPLSFLLAVVRGEIVPSPAQVRAAVAAARFVHRRPGADGKRVDERDAAVRAASSGRLAAPPAPLRLLIRNKPKD